MRCFICESLEPPAILEDMWQHLCEQHTNRMFYEVRSISEPIRSGIGIAEIKEIAAKMPPIVKEVPKMRTGRNLSGINLDFMAGTNLDTAIAEAITIALMLDGSIEIQFRFNGVDLKIREYQKPVRSYVEIIKDYTKGRREIDDYWERHNKYMKSQGLPEVEIKGNEQDVT